MLTLIKLYFMQYYTVNPNYFHSALPHAAAEVPNVSEKK